VNLRDIPTLLLTCRRDSTQADWLLKGADECLVRPYSDVELIARCSSQIRHYDEQTQVKQTEHQLRSQVELATAAKDAFLASVSHELRTPLAPVLMLVEELCVDGELPETY